MTTRPTPPAPPEFGAPLAPAWPSEEILTRLAQRRSTAAAALTEPGPSPDELDALLRVAARVPDHGKLAPWRFVVFEGEARAKAGALLEKVARARNPELDDAMAAAERERFLRAPVVVAVISSVIENHKIPEWEQILSAGAVCQTLLLAAHASGFAGQWLSEWCAFDNDVRRAFGLGPGERIAGYIYLGTTHDEARERPRPLRPDLIARWG